VAGPWSVGELQGPAKHGTFRPFSNASEVLGKSPPNRKSKDLYASKVGTLTKGLRLMIDNEHDIIGLASSNN
jgi:hypothetical protein